MAQRSVADVMQRLQNRREANRLSARRHYNKKRVSALELSIVLSPYFRDLILRRVWTQQLIDQLRAEETELKMQHSNSQFFMLCSHPSQKSEDSGALIETLRRENAALRKRLQQFVNWECRLELILGPRLSADPLAPTNQSLIRLTKPLRVEECHAIAREIYKEIELFSTSGRDISSGASVFGWTDQRRVNNGQLKFALQKTFTQHSAYELASRMWDLIRNASSYVKLFSASSNMRYELVQEIDPNNVLFYQDYEVSVGDTLVVVRSLVLATQFETPNGYVILYYSIDHDRLERWPDRDRKCAVGTTITYHWQHLHGWTRAEPAGPNGEYCKSSYCGVMPTEDASGGFWMIEVLLQALRWENLVVRPLVTLANDKRNLDHSGHAA